MKSVMANLLVLASAMVLMAGCDARATSSDSLAVASRSDQKSREFESCAATLHCNDELRCFDQTCHRIIRSVVGDYQAALGAALRQRGKTEEAAAAYAAALARYDADKVPVPPEIVCGYGSTLAASRGKKEQSELAARISHRCVLAVPVGSSLYRQALTDLASLSELGLEPEVLAKAQPADLYLTRPALRRGVEAIAIVATAIPVPGGKSFGLVQTRINEADLRAPLIACWEAHFAATQKEELSVTFGLKGKQISEYEDEPGTYIMSFEPSQTASGGPGEIAEACVRNALEPIKKIPGLRDTISTKLTILMK